VISEADPVRANEVPRTECLEKGRRRTKGVLRDISQENADHETNLLALP
jgi:hypothetical protein